MAAERAEHDALASSIHEETRSAAHVRGSNSQAELVASEARQRGFLQAALDCIVMADKFGRVVEFNPAAEKTFGYSREQALGRTLEDLIIPPSLRPRHARAFERFVDTRRSNLLGQRIELVGMRADGSEFPVELALSQVEGEPLLICAALRDLSSDKDTKERLRQLADEQGELRRVATLVAQGAGPTEVFSAVAEAVAQILGVPAINMMRFEYDGMATKVAGWGESPFPVGSLWSLDEPSAMALVAQTGRPARIDDYAATPGKHAKRLHDAGFASGVGAPIIVDGRPWGAMIAFSATRLVSDDAEDRLVRFTELIGTAVSNATAHSALVESRSRIVATADEARRRVQRDIHDGAQQRLVAALLNLQVTSERIESDPGGAHVTLRAALQNVREGLEELRELAAGLHPSILSRGGLGAAVKALASRSHVAVTVRAPAKRYPERVEATAYFVVAEALTNVVKHAQASHAEVDIHDEAESLLVQVVDDGIGGATSERGSGLLGLKDRLETAAGHLRIESAVGAGTRVVAALPLS